MQGSEATRRDLFGLSLQALAPSEDSVYHRYEIVGVDGYLAIEALGPAEPCKGEYLSKAEQIGEYISLRGEADREDTAAAADER